MKNVKKNDRDTALISGTYDIIIASIQNIEKWIAFHCKEIEKKRYRIEKSYPTASRELWLNLMEESEVDEDVLQRARALKQRAVSFVGYHLPRVEIVIEECKNRIIDKDNRCVATAIADAYKFIDLKNLLVSSPYYIEEAKQKSSQTVLEFCSEEKEGE